jgi:putative aldouronate transport system permease protein
MKLFFHKRGLREGVSDRILDIVVTVSMLLMIVVMLYPFVYTISLSLSRPTAVIAGRVKLLPIGFQLDAYYHVFKEEGIINGFLISVFYVIAGTAALLLLASLTAYPLSLKVFYPRYIIMFLILFTMLFREGMIPRFIWIQTLGLLDTVWAIILPTAMTAWYVIIYRTFLQQHPESLRESALIDGANDFTILFRIVLPLSKPIIATLAVFHMVYHWNSFFPALLYLRSDHLMPVQMILRRVLMSATDIEEMLRTGEEVVTLPISVQAAFIVVIVFPIIVVYPFAQKYFTKGVMIGAIKG